MEKEVALRKKAELLCSGTVRIPKDMRLPFPTSKSSAGPGAGSESIVVCFSGLRAKVPISRAVGKIRLEPDGNKYRIMKGKRKFIEGVTLQPTLCHAPGQAFVSLGRSCTMDCAFCTINESAKKEGLTPEKALELILATSLRPGFESVAITSGVPTTVDAEVAQMAALVKLVKMFMPGVPVGVEPLVSKRSHIRVLREAGAEEIKINIEAANERIFRKVCPKRDYQNAIEMIKEACKVFGRGKVTSNIIVGLGESDKDVESSLRMLAEIGAVGNVRMQRTNERNRRRISRAIGKVKPMNEDRLLKLAMLQKRILAKHKLSTSSFKTMCFPCSCCDIVEPDVGGSDS